MANQETAASLDNIGFGTRGLVLEHVTSADGTRIAFEKSGEGPPVIILGGGLNEKAMFADLAELLSEDFTVYNYDRRGRGNSEDNGGLSGYTVDREVEDLAAVLAAAGPEAAIFANCTGGLIAMQAAAKGVPMGKMALYEPTYGGHQLPESYMDDLERMVAADHRTDAVALFLKENVRFSSETIEGFKSLPIWPSFEAMAPTTLYDSILDANHESVPFDQLPGIGVPTLVIGGRESPSWLIDNCHALADGLPNGQYVCMNEGHLFNQKAGAPLLTVFFRSQ
ncbi:alpha/beta fold hydrolase [Amycolatopsis speibonae]|uniref:Alpha/beta fold hydrolase n=1 Tax=Amycolatopsis speibonae TaxID=1450224 RepID=A0ABV7NWW9_9PSEU